MQPDAGPDGSEDLVWPNGVDATTGGYLLPPLTPEDVAAVATGQPPSPKLLAQLTRVYRDPNERYLGVAHGIDPEDLARAGWGVIFAQDADPTLCDLLKPLLDLRRRQAGKLFRAFRGAKGVAPGESALDFLVRHGGSIGPVDPKVSGIPYYLLIVAGPETIPFQFQYELDVTHAVGRIWFDSPGEFSSYADAVVAADNRRRSSDRSVSFFATSHPQDRATQRSSESLARPLAAHARAKFPDWTVTECIGPEARKPQLTRMLGGDLTPTLFFSATHGLGLPSGHELQVRTQGALLCQEWSGRRDEPVPPHAFLAATDLNDAETVPGSVFVLFACYGGGTPATDAFVHEGADIAIAPSPFVARLPQTLLARGALAVIAHVDRAWSYSFSWPRAGTQLETFSSTFDALMTGQRLGSAMEYFNQRHAGLGTAYGQELLARIKGKAANDVVITRIWTAYNDARNYVVLGDPAVRLRTD